MRINRLVVGPVSTNCYIVSNENTKEALIIDPGEGAKKIIEKIKEEAKFYYERGYYTENKKSENTKEKNKQLLKRKDDNNG